jgi:hypothetical protein
LFTKLSIDLFRAAADRADREAQAEESRACKARVKYDAARMRYDAAAMEAQAARGRAEEAHKSVLSAQESYERDGGAEAEEALWAANSKARQKYLRASGAQGDGNGDA